MGLDQFDAVFVPGGHGPKIDLLDHPDAGIVMRHFHGPRSQRRCCAMADFTALGSSDSKEFVAALAAGDAAGAHAKAEGWIYAGYR